VSGTMASNLDYLEGRKVCVVFVKVVDKERERVRLQCFRGRGSIERGKLNVVDPNGAVFGVPSSAYPTIMPNDGSDLLKDADYFVLVRTDESIQLVGDPVCPN